MVGPPLGWDETYISIISKRQEFMKALHLVTYNNYKDYSYYDVLGALSKHALLASQKDKILLEKSQDWNQERLMKVIIAKVNKELNVEEEIQENVLGFQQLQEAEHEIKRKIGVEADKSDPNMDPEMRWAGMKIHAAMNKKN